MPDDQEEIMNHTPLIAGCLMHPLAPAFALQVHLMEEAVKHQQLLVAATMKLWSPFFRT